LDIRDWLANFRRASDIWRCSLDLDQKVLVNTVSAVAEVDYSEKLEVSSNEGGARQTCIFGLVGGVAGAATPGAHLARQKCA